MAYHNKHLKVDKKSRVSVTLGYKTMQIIVTLPLQQIAVQVVRAAFGSKASVTNKRNGK